MHFSRLIVLLTVLCTIAVPLLMFRFVEDPESERVTQQTDGSVYPTESITESVKISVFMPDETVTEMDLEEYILSVVLREMPSSFESEALKAQAVVARTYALRRQERGGKHDLAAVCTDPGCCQGYCSPEEYVNSGGATASLEKVRQAVYDTAGEVLMYNGTLAEATYFSCSGGYTEDAKAVWGTDIPYLQATYSPGEEHATYYTDTVTITADEFRRCIEESLPGFPGDWFGAITYTAGGGVDSIEICGKRYTGSQIRQALQLRSTAFVITPVGNSITITTKGYGHRVGMSQYGADAMAVRGSSYKDILQYYYKGTELFVNNN